MSGKARTGVNVGGSYILVIFVLLCLTTFATLSMVSANADYNLSKKAADSTSLFYQADAQAEERLAEIGETLASAYPLAEDWKAYYILTAEHLDKVGDYEMWVDDTSLMISYQVPMGEQQALDILVEVFYPPEEHEQFRRKKWQVINTREWEVQETVPDLWDGGEMDLGGIPIFLEGE